MNRRAPAVIVLLVFWSLVALSSNALAENWNLLPMLSISGTYDDNVGFTSTEKTDDYYSTLRPSLSLGYNSELTRLKGTADILFLNFANETDLNTVNFYGRLDGDTRLTERSNLSADLRYAKDTLLDSELDETGVVFDRSDRQRYDANAYLRFDATRLSAIGLSYLFNRVEYEEEDREDRDLHTVYGFFRRSFSDGRNSLELRPGYTFRNSDTVDADSYSMQVGWAHRSTELGTIGFYVGGRYTEEKRPNEDKQDSSGFTADLDYSKKWQVSSLKLTYKRDQLYDADDQLRVVDRITAEYQQRLSERLEFNLRARFFYTSLDFQEDLENTQFFDIQPWVQWNLTELHYLSLAYKYSQGYDETRTDEDTAARNQVTLSVVFQFPKGF